MQEHVQRRAYGSMWLFGEYAFTYQKSYGIALAIDQSILVTLRPREDDKISMSSQLGKWESSIQNLDSYPKELKWFEELRSLVGPLMIQGFDLDIQSTIDVFVGLGSSHALFVAALSVICAQLGYDETFIVNLIKKHCNDPVRSLELPLYLASFYGCNLAYHFQKQDIIFYPISLDITVLYTGARRTFFEGKQELDALLAQKPVEYAQYLHEIVHITQQAMAALSQENLHRLGELMSLSYGLQKKLGFCDSKIEKMYDFIMKSQDFLGAKLSGPGKGECFIALGSGFLALPLDWSGARVFHMKTPVPSKNLLR